MHWSSFQPPGRAAALYGGVLRANRAVRLGLRAASRNPELAFGKGLLDAIGTLLALLPPAMGVAVLFSPVALSRLLQVAKGVSLAVLGGVFCAVALAFVASLFFWAGAVPVLAADIEVDRRPPSGNFVLLASRGFERMLRSGAMAWSLPLLFSIALASIFGVALPLALLRRSTALLAFTSAIGAIAIAGAVLLDVLARLVIVRAGAFGEGVSVSFGKASSLLSQRLGACTIVAAAYLVLELIVASAGGLFSGVISSGAFFNPRVEAYALPARAAVALAFAVVFAWLEVAKMGSFAAIALDADGLVASEPEPRPPPPPVAIAEPVIEALPVDDETL